MGVGNQKKAIVKPISSNVFCGVRLGGMGVAIGSLVGKELAELIDYYHFEHYWSQNTFWMKIAKEVSREILWN